MGISGRFAGLKPSMWLKADNKVFQQSDAISARLAALFGCQILFRRCVDVNEVGQTQLLQFNVHDPDGADEGMNAIAVGSGVTYPESVRMSFSGFMDMDLKLGGVSPQELEVKRFPVSSFINSYRNIEKKIGGSSIKMKILFFFAFMSSCLPEVHFIDRPTVMEEESAGDWPDFELLLRPSVKGYKTYGASIKAGENESCKIN